LLSALGGCSQIASPQVDSTSTSRDDSTDLNFAAGWEFQSEKAVLKHSVLSPDDTERMVSASVLATESDAERVRWDYLKEVSSDFASHFTDTSFEQGEFLVVVESLLPESHTIDDGKVSYDGERLSMDYEVVPSKRSGKAVTFSHSIEKWRAPESKKPQNVAVKLCYSDSER